MVAYADEAPCEVVDESDDTVCDIRSAGELLNQEGPLISRPLGVMICEDGSSWRGLHCFMHFLAGRVR